MAQGVTGSIQIDTSSGLSMRVDYSERYELTGNYSYVDITGIWIKSTSYYGNTYYPDGIIKVNGANVVTMNSNTGTGSARIQVQNQWYKCSNSTGTSGQIAHSTDGTKTVSIEIVGNRYSTFRWYTTDGYGGSGWGGTKSSNITLTTIPRAAEFSSVPSSVTMGSATTIGVSIKSSSFTHTLSWKIGTHSENLTIPSDGNVRWTPSSDLVQYLPNATSGTITFTLLTTSGGTTIGKIEKSVPLYVPGKSTLSISGDLTMGTAKSITVNVNSSKFTNTLTWRFITAVETTLTIPTNHVVSFTPSTSLASRIPNALSGSIVFTLTTKNGTATVGQDVVTKTLNMYSYTPTVTLTVAPHSSNATVDGWGVGVKGYSYIHYSTSVSGLNSATVKSYTVTFAGGNTKTTASGDSVVLSNKGSVAVKVVITDSRGKTASDTESVYFYDYGNPGYKNQNAFRCNSDGTANPVGTYLSKVITAVNSYSCGGNNTLTCKWRFKLVSDPETRWSAYASLTSGSKDVSPSNLNPGKPYLVELVVTDALGTASSIKVTVPTENVPFNLKEGGKGAAFFGYSQTDGALEVYGDIQGTGKILLSKNVSEPTYAHIKNTYVGDTYVKVENANGAVCLDASDNRGLWDTTRGTWMWYRNKTDQAVYTDTPVSINNTLVANQFGLNKNISAAPSETNCCYFFNATKDISIGGMTMPQYSKGIFVSNGADATIYGVDTTGRLFTAFRNGTSWIYGTRRSVSYTNSVSSPAKSVPSTSSSYTGVCSISNVTAGIWLAIGSIRFGGTTAGGYRCVSINNATGASGFSAYCCQQVTPISGATTWVACAGVVEITSTQTIYLNAQQTCGSALDCGGWFRITRL